MVTFKNANIKISEACEQFLGDIHCICPNTVLHAHDMEAAPRCAYILEVC